MAISEFANKYNLVYIFFLTARRGFNIFFGMHIKDLYFLLQGHATWIKQLWLKCRLRMVFQKSGYIILHTDLGLSIACLQFIIRRISTITVWLLLHYPVYIWHILNPNISFRNKWKSQYLHISDKMYKRQVPLFVAGIW